MGRGGVKSRRLQGALRFGPRSTTDASTVPLGPSRSDGVPHVSHVLIKVWHVFHVLSRSRLSTDETWTPGSFGARLCPRYKKKASQAIAIIVSWDFDETTSWMLKMKKILCLHVCWVHTSSLCVSKKKASSSCRECQSAAVRKKAKKADEKAKIHVGARMVIGRQKAAAGPLHTLLNDLPNALQGHETHPVILNNKLLNCLMYADDIALISQSKEGLQCCLNKLNAYCKTWQLTVNNDKTKVVVFNKTGKMKNDSRFHIDGKEFETVKEMKYLGIIFNNNGTFNSATENLKDKSSKALFKLFKSFGSETPSIKTATHLFDAMITPILLYNSEIGGNTIADYNKLLEEGSNKTKMYFQNTFEKMHVKWCKYLLGVHSKSTNTAVLAELGRYPLILEVILNQIKFWIRMTGCKCNANSLLYDCYKTNDTMMQEGKSCWLKNIKTIPEKIGMNELLPKPDECHLPSVKRKVKQKLRNIFAAQFESDLHGDVRNNGEGTKLRTLRMFKINMKEELYLTLIANRNIRTNFTKLRISAHNLPIETGRHRRNGKIPLKERKCDMCDDNTVGSEFHTVMSCEALSVPRKCMFDEISIIFPPFKEMCEDGKFIFLMQCNDPDLARQLANYIKCINLYQR